MVGWIDAHGERLQPGSQVCRVMEKEGVGKIARSQI